MISTHAPARCSFVLASLALFLPALARAEAPALDAATLKKVKAATAHLQVKFADDREAQGSGFFIDEPGLLVTNAHVLNMLDPESRPPSRVDVTLTDAAGKQRTLPAKIVGVDRGGDLALLRIADKTPPEALKIGNGKDVKETDTVFVFGFPFGKDLGKEITVNKSTVSSLRKNGSLISRIQLDGGLNPGNSGGPVVDGNGNVIGVAVSGVRGTQIGFAIPAEDIGFFLNGRVIGAGHEVPFKDAKGMKLPCWVDVVDPLGRLKKLELEFWAAAPGPYRPSTTTEPAAVAGDGPKTRQVLTTDRSARIIVEVALPALDDPKLTYWMRPIVTTGNGETRWLGAGPLRLVAPLERKPITLKYQPPVGGKQTAELTSGGGFRIRTEEGEEHSLSLDLRTAFTEKFAAAEAKAFPFRLTYDRFGLGIKVDNKPLPDEADIRKILNDVRFLAADVEMDKDGSVTKAKADLTAVPKGSREGLDSISDQILQSLEVLSVPLPDKKIEAKESWKARRNFLVGSSILSVPAQADVVYTYLGVGQRNGKEAAMIAITGKLQGRRGEGLDLGGSVRGTAWISTETGEVLYATAAVKADCDLTFAKKPAKAAGTLNVSIQRPAPAPEKK